MNAKKVLIVGLNRVSASIGLALRAAAPKLTVVGFDRNQQLARQAAAVGALNKRTRNLPDAVQEADVVLFAVPGTEVPKAMPAIAADLGPHALLLDVTSLKQTGLALAQQHLSRGHYIGVHPVLAAAMLADGRAGIAEARADLFQNSLLCLMPTVDVDPAAVETAVAFGKLLGARPYFIEAAEYDKHLQGIESVPGLLAAALFQALSNTEGWRDILRFAGPHFAQATAPLASGSEIAHLVAGDRQAALRWLDALLDELQALRYLVHREQPDALSAMLDELSEKRATWLEERARNAWIEDEMPEIPTTSFREQMLGKWRSKDSSQG